MKNVINNNLSDLHPIFASRCIDLLADLTRQYESGKTQCRFEVFESVRSPARQNHLFAAKRSKATAWQSAHQYGLAADFVPRVVRRSDGREVAGWTWDVPLSQWDILRATATKHGLVNSIPWDRAHVESGMWSAWRSWMKG